MMIDPISRFLLRTRAAADGRDGDPETVVLMYHGVVARGGRPNTRFDVGADAFARQLDLLAAAGFTTARVADLVAAPADVDAAPANGRRRAVITFDDGFRNNFEGAVRPLLDRRMTASWFVVSDFLGRLASWMDGDRREREILTAPELRAMTAAGLEVGSHTRRHLDLTKAAPGEIEGEVAGSKRDLESLLSAPVRTFAYPYGRLNDFVRAAVLAAGYVAACATRSGSVRTADDRYALRRITITWGDTPSSFARKLALADNDVAWGNVARHGVRHLHARLRAG